jgi:serine protease DegQ
VAALKPGTQAKFRALRGRESLDLSVTPGLRPKPSKLPAQQR